MQVSSRGGQLPTLHWENNFKFVLPFDVVGVPLVGTIRSGQTQGIAPTFFAYVAFFGLSASTVALCMFPFVVGSAHPTDKNV